MDTRGRFTRFISSPLVRRKVPLLMLYIPLRSVVLRNYQDGPLIRTVLLISPLKKEGPPVRQ